MRFFSVWPKDDGRAHSTTFSALTHKDAAEAWASWRDTRGELEMNIANGEDVVVCVESPEHDVCRFRVSGLSMEVYSATEVNEAGRAGHWFQTYNGVRFYPLDPRQTDILIEDIAHHLASCARFNGATVVPYSVAQHSVMVSRLVPAHVALEGLLHDAAEAYMGDLIRPIKLDLPRFREIEHKIEQVIALRFGLDWPWPTVIKQADNRALMTERRDLLLHQLDWTTKARPVDEAIVVQGFAEAKTSFLGRFNELWRSKVSAERKAL